MPEARAPPSSELRVTYKRLSLLEISSLRPAHMYTELHIHTLNSNTGGCFRLVCLGKLQYIEAVTAIYMFSQSTRNTRGEDRK
jgi:hypothetical protein